MDTMVLTTEWEWEMEKEEETTERPTWDPEMTARLRSASLDEDIVDAALTAMSSRKNKFLISCMGDKVPISYLKGKTIGLCFYYYKISISVFFDLIQMYKKLKEMGENFEIVFVCLHLERPRTRFNNSQLLRSYEESVETRFDKYFRGHTWLALPFAESKCNLMFTQWYRFRKHGEGMSDFVIIQPGEKFTHTRPMDVYKDYGIKTYPFSKSRAIEIEVARFKSLTLDQVLFSGAAAADEKFVYDQDRRKISASLLVGKKILLFFTLAANEIGDRCFLGLNDRMYEEVIQSYIERKRCDKSFEMLHVFYKEKHEGDQILKKASKCRPKKMSPLEFPYDTYDLEALYGKLLKARGSRYIYVPMCVAFGKDGRFITMRIFPPTCGKPDNVDYDHLNLFSADDLYAQVHNYISIVMGWSTDDE